MQTYYCAQRARRSTLSDKYLRGTMSYTVVVCYSVQGRDTRYSQNKLHLNWLILFFPPSRFEVSVRFAIPNIIIQPTLDTVKTSLARIAEVVLNVADKILYWAGDSIGESFLIDIADEPAVQSTMRQLDGVVDGMLRFSSYFF